MKGYDPWKDDEQAYGECDRRDHYYSAVVKDIVSNNRTNQKQKWAFLIVVCVVFCFSVGFGLWIIFNISKKPDIEISDIGVSITGFGSVLSAIIVLPTIIAKHLFPENSEEIRFGLVKDIQKNDLNRLNDDVSDVEDEEENEGDKEKEDDEGKENVTGEKENAAEESNNT